MVVETEGNGSLDNRREDKERDIKKREKVNKKITLFIKEKKHKGK